MHILIIINVDSLRQNKNKHYYNDKYKQNMGSFSNHCQARLHLENCSKKHISGNMSLELGPVRRRGGSFLSNIQEIMNFSLKMCKTTKNLIRLNWYCRSKYKHIKDHIYQFAYKCRCFRESIIADFN